MPESVDQAVVRESCGFATSIRLPVQHHTRARYFDVHLAHVRRGVPPLRVRVVLASSAVERAASTRRAATALAATASMAGFVGLHEEEPASGIRLHVLDDTEAASSELEDDSACLKASGRGRDSL